MQRRISLLEDHYDVTVFGRSGEWQIQVNDGETHSAALTTVDSETRRIHLGDQNAPMHIAFKGETAYVKAFDRTFTLQVVDPVEQAAEEAGGRSNTARAPMPGVVVEIKVTVGERVSKGQPVMTIESMKILTVVVAPRDGQVAQIHFEPGQTFDKNAPLITLAEKEET
jgi:biotin carboxyl carrier protein